VAGAGAGLRLGRGGGPAKRSRHTGATTPTMWANSARTSTTPWQAESCRAAQRLSILERHLLGIVGGGGAQVVQVAAIPAGKGGDV